MKLKHGSNYGRPIKGNDNIIAPRREVSFNQTLYSNIDEEVKAIIFF